MLAAFAAIAEDPARPTSRPIPGLGNLRAIHLRFARRLPPREDRVANPRHIVLYRLAADGIVEILSLVHDRQLLPRAARRAQRQTRA